MQKISKSLFLATFLLSSCATTTSSFFESRSPSSTATVMIPGLQEVDLNIFKEWSQGLLTGTIMKGPYPSDQLLIDVEHIYETSKNINEFVTGIMALKLNGQYQRAADYLNTAQNILAIRNEIRVQLDKRPVLVRQAMLFLNMLAEETLYVAHLKFPNEKLTTADFGDMNIESCHGRVATLNGIKLCEGDILASKGGAGSSSFIARIADYPGNFSHSTIPLIKDDKSLLLIEADIDDGVKLRSTDLEYVNDHKAKLFVYRSKNTQTVANAHTATSAMYALILKRLNGLDPKTNSSFDYDFAMNAEDSSKLFCSEVPYFAYSLNPQTSSDNPYSKKYWSSVKDSMRRNFLEKFLGIGKTFPAPSDIELNPHYDIVAMQFDLTKMSKDRIMNAMIDSLFYVLKTNESKVNIALSRLDKLGNEVATSEDVKKKLDFFKAKGIKIPDAVYEQAKTVPKGINYKQMVFFSFLNGTLAPKVLQNLTLAETGYGAQGKILDLGTMRSMIVSAINSEVQTFMETVNQAMQK